MTEMNEPHTLSLRDTARGIAVRAGLLSIVAIVAGTWLFSLAAKAASGAVKIVSAILLLAIGGLFASWQVRKVRQRFGDEGGGSGAGI